MALDHGAGCAKVMRRILKIISGFVFCSSVALFTPLALAHLRLPPTARENLQPADAALVFGAIVRNGAISPLHQERLDAAKDLYANAIVSKVVVSNAPTAVQTMARYLQQNGIPQKDIEIDSTAIITSDTCRAEAHKTQKRHVIFVSQGFHLPRVAHLCAKYEVAGQLLAAEAYRPDTAQRLPIWRVLQIRAYRHTREATLLWAEYLGLYD